MKIKVGDVVKLKPVKALQHWLENNLTCDFIIITLTTHVHIMPINNIFVLQQLRLKAKRDYLIVCRYDIKTPLSFEETMYQEMLKCLDMSLLDKNGFLKDF